MITVSSHKEFHSSPSKVNYCILIDFGGVGLFILCLLLQINELTS